MLGPLAAVRQRPSEGECCSCDHLIAKKRPREPAIELMLGHPVWARLEVVLGVRRWYGANWRTRVCPLSAA